MILVESALARDGRTEDFLPLQTDSLKYPSYHTFLHDRFPKMWPDTVSAAEQTNGVSPLHLMELLSVLSKTNELYYLHPSFGYYFELFYAEPHGPVYKLKTLPNDTLLPPLPDKNQVAANENFWAQAQKTAFDPIIRAVTPHDENAITVTSGKNFCAAASFRTRDNQTTGAIVAGTFTRAAWISGACNCNAPMI